MALLKHWQMETADLDFKVNLCFTSPASAYTYLLFTPMLLHLLSGIQQFSSIKSCATLR